MVYHENQQQIEYLVEFTFENEQINKVEFPSSDQSNRIQENYNNLAPKDFVEPSSSSSKKPLLKSGLRSSSGDALPLKSVCVKGKLLDMIGEITIFQHYRNEGDTPIEAKYVFPLDEMSSVCGFEAFINGKHIIGQVKEKEEARKEYKEAISKGHGAYLM